ncbi:unnamed protein product [Caenorhabditis auriculariae]|uniref:Uncharacterized protein n=1 Tax=Caenorhabditis auriculariae TaxID=2777116 RepID=A0A8S1HCP3_9PELO|nr:unnamed protein product [Caenorhabditis auriculariae]
MLSSNMSIVNDYIMFRLLIDDADKHKQKRNSLTPRPGFMMPRGSIGSEFEPFCSPMVPHVPIRERLARRGTSADVSDDVASGYNCYAPRRRRMSLLQSLRYQNKALADSGCDIHRVRTDSESTNRDTCSPPQKTSPPVTPNNKKTFSQLKTKIFGKKEKGTPVYNNGEYSQSCDVINNGRPSSRKSPSTTNDSGRGSQGHLEERLETMAIIEREDEPDDLEEDVVEMMKPLRPRTNSCPDLSTLRFLSPKKKASASTSSASRRAPIVDSESDEDRTISPVTAADCLHERRLQRKFEEQRRQQQLAMSHIDEEGDVISRLSGVSQRVVCRFAILSLIKRRRRVEHLASLVLVVDVLRAFPTITASPCRNSTAPSLSRADGLTPGGYTASEAFCVLKTHHPSFRFLFASLLVDGCQIASVAAIVSSMKNGVFRTAQTENLADFDDNVSSIVLDHFLSSTQLNLDADDSSEFSLTDFVDPCDRDPTSSSTNTATSVQTDLSLLNVEEQLTDFLEHCRSNQLDHEPPDALFSVLGRAVSSAPFHYNLLPANLKDSLLI